MYIFHFIVSYIDLMSNYLCCCRDGRLRENDQILAIDGQVLEANISHPQAISLLQKASGRVELIVARGAPLAPRSHRSPQSEQSSALGRTPSAVSDNSDMVVSVTFVWSVESWITMITITVTPYNI